MSQIVEAIKEKKRGYVIVPAGEGGVLSHYRRWINKYDIPINIPVIDVRDGVGERLLAESIEKAQNKSRWINYNQYHVSPKKKKTL